jgi:hypothetical protein
MDDLDSVRRYARAYIDEATKLGTVIEPSDLRNLSAIFSSGSIALAGLIKLERAAFGLSDADGPSEFDTFSEEQLAELEAMIRKVIE